MNWKARAALAMGLGLLGLPSSTAQAQGTKSLMRNMALGRAERLYQRGNELTQARQPEAALLKYAQAQAFYLRARDALGEGRASVKLGSTLQTLRGCREAMPPLRRALTQLQEARDRQGAAEASFVLGQCYLEEFNSPKQALEHLQRAATLLGEDGDRMSQGLALMSVGQALFKLGRKAEGADTLKQAGALLEAGGNGFLAASTWLYLAVQHAREWDHPRSREYLLKALSLYESSGQWLLVAMIHEQLASNANLQGQFREQLTHYQGALSLYEKLKLPVGQARLESYLGDFYHLRGDYPLALHHLERALTAWSAAERQPEGSTLPSPGQLPAVNLTEAMAQADAQLRKRLEDPRGGRVWALSLMGNLHQQMKKPAAAMERYEQALPLARAQGDRGAELDLLGWIGTLHRGNKAFPEAIAAYARALSLAKERGDVFEEARLLSELSMTHILQGEPGKAREVLGRIEPLLGTVPLPAFQAVLLNFLGLNHGELKDYDRALAYYQRALAIYEQLGERERVVETLNRSARLHVSKGESDKALELYQRALALHETLRTEAGIEELKAGLSAQGADMYASTLQLLLARGDKVQAFELSERSRARTFLDTLGNARTGLGLPAGDALVTKERTLARQLAEVNEELRSLKSRAGQVDQAALDTLDKRRSTLQTEVNALLVRIKATHPRYASLQSVEPLGLQESQRLLDGSTTLVSYLVLPKQVVAFIITRDAFDAVELPLTQEEVRRFITNATVTFKAPKVDASQALQELHELFVAPLTPYLKTARVGIIPHGPLHYLPFAALKEGERYFGEKHTLFSLPSVSALRYLPKKQTNKGGVLAIAQGQAEGLPTLRFADEEAMTIARLYGAQALIGATATESALKEGVRKASILHVAAHGEFKDDSPLFSRIILAPGAGDDGSLTVEEIYDLDLSATQLVVLSACQTQMGAQSRGDDMVGLSRAFLYAQAPTVLASLWSVNDKATGLLMTTFHTQLKKGKPKAEALREAQAQVRARFPHPFYWAAFVLTGEPG